MSNPLGIDRIVVLRDKIGALGGDPEATVRYGPRSREVGLASFPLALDGGAHVEARARIGGVLGATVAAHRAGVSDAAATAEQFLPVVGTHVDVAADVVEPALAAWIERWFGLPGRGMSLMRTSRFIAHAMFLNPKAPFLRTDGRALHLAVDVIQREREELEGALARAPRGTIAGELSAVHASAAEAANDVLGLTVGPLALGAWAIDDALAFMLRRSNADAVAASSAGARGVFHASLQSKPPLPGFYREKKGRVELAFTRFALRFGRAPSSRLAFGTGTHACMGPDHITDVAEAILRAVAARRPSSDSARPKARPAGAPDGVSRWPFPGHLEVLLAG